MFTKTLLPDTFRVIKLVSTNVTVKNAYLAGGTALALQIGHRISVDLDFFTNQNFDERSVSSEINNIDSYVEGGTSDRTIWGKIGQTKFSLFYYKYPLLENTSEFSGIQLASLKDISAMKIHAVSSRGTKRDFIDLYFLSERYSIDEMFKFYDQKYNDLDEKAYHLIRSLDYFIDAEIDPMPKMIKKISWNKIKAFFKSESLRLSKKYL